MSHTPQTVGDYEIIRPLAEGSQGQTFLGRGVDGEEVVLKRFSIRKMRDWKSLELFQREIAALRMLDHPAIPAFIDDVELEDSHYLVQAYVEGRVLSELTSGPFSNAELSAVACDMLDVLSYLHELNPPVVHRDVKPSNIIRGPDGYALVDFGGVQMIVAQDTGGSTVIGTTGYMPSEQLIGRAEPRSDLYALGATLAHLATGVHPSQLPTKRLRIDWRSAAPDVSPHLAALIDQMLEPAPEDRPASAREALNSLPGAAPPAPEPAQVTTLEKRPVGQSAIQKHGVSKPKGHCPRPTAERFTQEGDAWIVDLRPKLDSNDLAVSIAMIAGGCTMGLVMWHIAPVLLGMIFALVNVFTTWASPSRESLHIAPDRRYLHSVHDDGSEAEVRGRLGRSVAVNSSHIALMDEADEAGPKEIFVGAWLSSKERQWVAWRVQLVLESGEQTTPESS